PDRHQTLRAALDWSYQLLPAAEQRLLRALSVFVGGCTLEAVGQVALAPPLDGLTSLLDKSLLRRSEGAEADTRCYMLETVRQYAWERLADSGDLAAVRARHADYCVRLAERAEPELVGPDQVRWLEQ